MTVLTLQASDSGPIEPSPDRGRLLTAKEVSEMIGGGVSEAWARTNVPHKLQLGHRTVRWYEADVSAWLESRRNDQ